VRQISILSFLVGENRAFLQLFCATKRCRLQTHREIKVALREDALWDHSLTTDYEAMSRFQWKYSVKNKNNNNKKKIYMYIPVCMCVHIYCHVSGVPWRIITDFWLDDWIYWHFYYNYSLLQSTITVHNRWLPKTRSIPSRTTNIFSSTVTITNDVCLTTDFCWRLQYDWLNCRMNSIL
jgi:hypothetical protein